MSVDALLSHPVSNICGELTVPGDKSISHRALILGSIANGCTEVTGFLPSDDCLATLKIMRALGVRIEQEGEGRLSIDGVGMHGLKQSLSVLDCGNSGTSMRLLTGLLAAQPFSSSLTGDSSLLQRPMSRVSTPLLAMGAEVTTCEGKPPINITPVLALKAISFTIPVVSAQVKSAILLASLYAEGVTCIKERGISRDHTERMLKTFSYPVSYQQGEIRVKGGEELKAAHLSIPGDLSSAAFFIVAATIIPGSKLLLRHVGINPTRSGIIAILRKMGANIRFIREYSVGEEPVADIQVCSAPLRGITIPTEWVSLAIDEFPILFIAAACAVGETRVQQAQELRIKESDRLSVMAQGLTALGIAVEEFADGIAITGGTIQGGTVESQGDHRIAMAFAIAGACAKDAILIKNCQHIATSFPNFVATANDLNFEIGSIHE